MQKLTFIFFLLITTTQAQTWEWTKSAGGLSTNNNGIYDIKTLSNGDVISCGQVGQNAVFGNFVVSATSPNKNSGFVACQDSSGNYKWVQVAQGVGFGEFFTLVVDSKDNIFVAADFFEDFTFAGVQIQNNDTLNIYGATIIKLNSAGSFLWSNVVGQNNFWELAPRIALDKKEDIKLLYSSTAINSTSFFSDYIFVTFQSVTGNIITSDTLGSAHNTKWAFDVNPINNESVFWLDTQDSANIRGQLFYPNAGRKLILKLDTMLNIIFAMQYNPNSSGGINGHTLKITQQNEILFCNTFNGTLQIQNHTLPSPNQFSSNSFIVKIDSNGNVNWLKGLISNSTNVMTSLTFDEDYNIYWTGGFADGFTYDTNMVTSLGFNNHFDALLIKLDSTGLFRYALQSNGIEDEGGWGIHHAKGSTFWGGYIYGDCIFGPDTLTISTPNNEMFISKISEPYLASIPNVENKNSAIIYPNPCTGIFQIKTTHALTLEIYNLTGQLQIKKNILAGTQIINALHLSKGIYFAKMYSENMKQAVTQKLIIQ